MFGMLEKNGSYDLKNHFGFTKSFVPMVAVAASRFTGEGAVYHPPVMVLVAKEC